MSRCRRQEEQTRKDMSSLKIRVEHQANQRSCTKAEGPIFPTFTDSLLVPWHTQLPYHYQRLLHTDYVHPNHGEDGQRSHREGKACRRGSNSQDHSPREAYHHRKRLSHRRDALMDGPGVGQVSSAFTSGSHLYKSCFSSAPDHFS
jgi:hypothetical protein